MDCARSHLQKTTSPREENSPLFQFAAVAGFLLRLHSALIEYSQGLSSMGCLPGAGSCRNQALALKTPASGSMSATVILRQLSNLLKSQPRMFTFDQLLDLAVT